MKALTTKTGFSDACRKLSSFVGIELADDQYMEMINDPPTDRGNRLCVTVSDIHLTDGTVGFQNLGKDVWEAFYQSLLQRCQNYHIDEVLFVMDGDIVDMIRSGRWAEFKIYPWERERKQEFSKVVNLIIRDIVEKKHKDFFDMLSQMPDRLKENAGVENVKVVITLGNHDKELLCDQPALGYFYEKALGIQLQSISLAERQAIGRMYGQEDMFDDLNTAPYLPFYYGDLGFRFFTTHGQWRDKDNCRSITASRGLPGWSVNNGWDVERWKKLHFAPFLLPCFGDSVAAGVLSTFIHEVKKQLAAAGYQDPRLDCILDELDLYRPTYAAVTRVLKETEAMRNQKRGTDAIKIIEETLYDCIINWLSWKFPYETSSLMRCLGLRFAKWFLEMIKYWGFGLEIKAIAGLMKVMAWFSRHHNKEISLADMRQFPAFLSKYRHYGFQIHGEGHTHKPLQEEPNIDNQRPTTYINFGSWRDQIVSRKNSGYRRHGVLRAFYILDLVNLTETAKDQPRTFDYFVEDITHWGDFKDQMDRKGRFQPKI